MKKLLLGAIGFAAMLTTGASAADLAPRPYAKAPAPMIAAMYDWSGFYIGLNGGGASSRKCWDSNSFNFFGFIVQNNPAVAEGCHDATGGVVGGQLGYRWQASAWVFGLEAQGDWANLRGTNASTQPLFIGTTNRSKIDAIGLFTGQIGYAVNNVLFYVKGGAMVVNDKYEGLLTATGAVFDSASETRWGGAVGVGLDYGVTPNIVLGIDYMHGFLGSRDITLRTPVGGVFSRTDRIHQDVDMVTARLSYKFGGSPVIAKY
jgi:outer membrane immunogenic protein